MNPASEQLERLISRYLDDECTPGQRRQLRAALRSDPAAEALFDEYSTLDREVGHALRHAMGRTLSLHAPRPRWSRIGRVFAVAAAACLAVMVWLGPPGSTGRGRDAARPARAGSWFAPPAWEDSFQTRPPVYEQPHVGLRGTDRHWIVIPGEGPGEYLIVEVDRVHVHLVAIREDF
jgi:hypothetical protein